MRMDRRAGLLAAGESAVGTWVFKSTITLEGNDTIYTVDFTSNGSNYNRFYHTGYGSTRLLIYGSTNVYGANGWIAPGYKTVVITGGTDVTNTALLTWLKNNATRQA